MSSITSLHTRKRVSQHVAFWIFRLTALAVVAVLVWILGFLFVNGASVISWEFLTSEPTNGMTEGGILPAIVGTLCLVAGSMLFAFPVGVLSGIYMNEYAKNGWIIRFIRMMTDNLGAIPSIVFGLFGMSLFVNALDFGDSIIAGSLTLGLLVLPIVIRTTEEALKTVDDTLRHASLALGASKFYTVCHVVLPVAMPNHRVDSCDRKGFRRNRPHPVYSSGILPAQTPEFDIRPGNGIALPLVRIGYQRH